MMEPHGQGSGFYRPCMDTEAVQGSSNTVQGFRDCAGTVQSLGVASQDMDDTHLVGVPVVMDAGDGGVGRAGIIQAPAAVAVEVRRTITSGAVVITTGEKRKRGRPPRAQTGGKPPPLKRKKDEDEEEDVCFICFDGGSLVLCDRKGCPKAYHPACIKRDESFFRSKAKWNCGWHICSVCQKAAYYMCYTCTFSLCKGCTKDSDYLCVRGNKGFCSTCMRTIMLIENKDQANSEAVQVDFDDKMSWEYLFKMYWIFLKDKLSLTFQELAQAKNPWKGVGGVVSMHQLPDVTTKHQFPEFMPKHQSPDVHQVIHAANGGNYLMSPKTSQHLELKRHAEHLEISDKEHLTIENREPQSGREEWASKELLEFVAHMRNGNISVLSQFDVQALLLDYIKKNNLRDPRRKSQIICDLRLKNLFGKPRVGHIEMLKLLEFHFLIKEEAQNNAFIPAAIVGSGASDLVPDVNNESSLINRNKKRKTRKKAEDQAPQTNLEEYAAIDVHNINLIYLRRSLMESLVEDKEKFHDKVVGSIVRIRISGSDQKQDIYRLVQVVGTNKVAVPYKLGNRTVDIMLEVLNLDKKEAISVDEISNQDFSEEECRRLRQSIRCGLVKRLTVGEVQMKAMALQPVRLNDWLEAEILRLNHLRDRANEKGHKKELRECIERVQLLKTPEERERRLCEIPQVHADPKMNPNYESEEDASANDNKKEENAKPRYSGCNRSGSKPMSPKIVKEERPIRGQHRTDEKTDVGGANSLEKHENCVHASDPAFLRSGSESSATTLSTSNSPSIDDGETDRLWHYRDPNGKVQGPFSMLQLRKWSTTGFFPPDMRIWINSEQNDSILLTDALSGQLHRAAQMLYDISLRSHDLGVTPDSKLHRGEGGWSENMDSTENDINHIDRVRQFVHPSVQSNANNEMIKTDRFSSIFPEHIDSLKGGDSSSDKPIDSGPFNFPKTEQVSRVLRPQGRVGEGDILNSVSNDGNAGSLTTSVCQIKGENTCENQSNSPSHLGQSSEQSWSLPANVSSTNMQSSSISAAVNKQNDASRHKGGLDLEDLPSPTPKMSVTTKDVGEHQPASAESPIKNPNSPDLPSPTPKLIRENYGGKPSEIKQSAPSSFPVQDSGPSWSTASSIVGGTRIPEIADGWGGYSPTPVKPSVQGWDSGFISASSLRPPEVVRNQVATPNSNVHHAHSSPSNLALHVSSWHEPIEFSTLAEESVSDLLAEVDAMESQSGLGSPTSSMKYSDDIMQGKNDCFNSIEELSPTRDPGKSDALSSTGEIQLPCQSTVTEEPVGASPVNAFDFLRRSGGNSSSSSEGETKSADAPVNQGETGSDIYPSAPHIMFREMANTTMGLSTGSPSAISQAMVGRTVASSTGSPCTIGQDIVGTTIASGTGLPCTMSLNMVGTTMALGTNSPPMSRDMVSTTMALRTGSPCTMSEDMVSTTMALGTGPLCAVSREMVSTTMALSTGSLCTTSQDMGATTMARTTGSQDMGVTTMARTTGGQDMGATSVARTTDLEVADPGWGHAQGNMNQVWGGSAQGVAHMGWGTSPAPAWSNPNAYRGPFGGGVAWDGQRQYGGERFGGPREWAIQGGDSGFGRGRPSWGRQPFGSGGGGYSKPSPKGQRICKFYESGRCKKGAACSYLHP